MESREIDVSRLAELSTVALLAGKVRMSLSAARTGRSLGNLERNRIRRGVVYLERLLTGLHELSPDDAARAAAPAQLYAMDSFIIASDAYARAASPGTVTTLDRQQVEVMRSFLEVVRDALSGLLQDPPEVSSGVDQADNLFAVLANYAKSQHTEILRTVPE
jgi:hypothetical protein